MQLTFYLGSVSKSLNLMAVSLLPLCLVSTLLTFSFFVIPILFSFVYRGNVDKREALENLDLILLCLDEIVDGGYAHRNLVFLNSDIFIVFSGLFFHS